MTDMPLAEPTPAPRDPIFDVPEPTDAEVQDAAQKVRAEIQAREEGFDIKDLGFPDLTPEDLDYLETRAASKIDSDEVKFGRKNIPFVGVGFEVGDILEHQQAEMAIRAGTATREQQLLAATSRIDQQREYTGFGEFQQYGIDAVTMGSEMALSYAGGAGAASVGTRVAARAGLKLAEAATSTMLLRRATELGLLTAGREAIPRTLGHEGGGWTAASLKRALPDMEISDEDAESLAAMSEAQFADVFLGKAFEQNSIYRGLAEDLASSTLEKAVGPALGKITLNGALKAFQGRVMQKLSKGVRTPGALAAKLRDVTAVNTGITEVGEEVIQNMAIEQFFGENMAEGLPESWQQLMAIFAVGSVPGTVGTAVETLAMGRMKLKREAARGEAKPEPLLGEKALGQSVQVGGKAGTIVGIQSTTGTVGDDLTPDPSQDGEFATVKFADGTTQRIRTSELSATAEENAAGVTTSLEGGDASAPVEATAATAGVETGVSIPGAAASPGEQIGGVDGTGQESDSEAVLAPFRPVSERASPFPEDAQGSVDAMPASAPTSVPGAENQVSIGRGLYGTLQAVPDLKPGGRVELPHVMKSLAGIVEAAGSKQAIRQGKAANVPSGAAGVYWTRGRMIDIRQANDIGTGAHEVAHSLERAIFGEVDPWKEGGGAKLQPSQRQELYALGKRLYGEKQPNGGYLREGWAELVRNYIVNDGDPMAPEMTRWLRDEFLAKRPAVRDAVEKARSEAQRWRLQGSPERVGASIQKRKGAIAKTKEALGTPEGRDNIKDSTYDNFVDIFGPYKRGVAEVEEAAGQKLAPSKDTNKLASALRQTGPSRLAYFIEHGGIDLAGNPTGTPSLDGVRDLVKGQGDEFAQYLYARRAKALWEQPIVEKLGPTENVQLVVEQHRDKLRNQAGERPSTETVLKHLGARDPGISYEDTIETLKVLENPSMQRAAELVHQWYDGVMDYVAGASPTLAQAVAAIREKDPGAYIPLRRVFSQLDGRGRGGGSASRAQVAKRLRGSGRQIVDPFPQLVAQAQRHIDMAHERAVLESVLEWRKAAPGLDHLVRELPPEQVPGASRSIDDLLAEIKRRNPDAATTVEGLREELGDSVDQVLTFFIQAQQSKKGDGDAPVIPVVENGKLKFFQVDKDIFDALEGLHVPQVGGMLGWLGATQKRMFTAGTTGLNPSFALVTNPLRDLSTFIANTEVANPVKMVWGYVSGLAESFWGATGATKLIGKDPTQFWSLYERLGVRMAERYAEDTARVENVAKRLAGDGNRILNFTGDAWEYATRLLNFPEGAGRLAEMKATAKRVGWHPGTAMSIDQAVEITLAGKQITVDFSAAGATARSINRFVPFFNVAFQSPRAYVRAIRRSPMKAVATGVSMFTMPALWMWLQNKDEEWYQEMSDEERYSYFYTSAEDGTLVRFPRSFEPHFVFATIPEILLNNLYKVNPDAAKTLAERVVGAMKQSASEATRVFTPNTLPPAAQVAAEQLANEVFFFDSPIVDRAMEMRPEEERFNEYTSTAAIKAGEILGVAPARIDHFIRGFTGSVGSDLLKLTGTGRDEIAQEGERADWPILGRLFKRGGTDGVRSRSVEAAYNAFQEAKENSQSLKKEETPDERDKRLFLGDVIKSLSALSTIRRVTEGTDERAKLARERRKLAQDAMQAIKDGTWSDSRKEMQKVRRNLNDRADEGKDQIKGVLREAAQE